jgi:alkaline phosphatase D
MTELSFHGKEERRWTGPRLRTAAIIGHTTTTTARIWIRCRHEGRYRLVLCSSALIGGDLEYDAESVDEYVAKLGGKVVHQESRDFRNDSDRTQVFDIQALSAGTRYHFVLILEDRHPQEPGPIRDSERLVIGKQIPHSFKTISSDDESLVFGLYSCNDPYKNDAGTMPWRHFHSVLTDQEADFVIGGGDQVYVDYTDTDIWKWLKNNKRDLLDEKKRRISEFMLSWYQDVYRGYWGFPHLRRVFRSFPNYMIWDDHEIMDGWGSRTRKELSDELDTWYEWEKSSQNLMLADKMFDAAKIVYRQYQHSHNPATADAVFDFPVTQKHAAFYFLDMRGHREFDLARLRKRDGKKATDRILGKRQLSRFFNWLDAVPKTTRIIYIVSPVPVIHWTGFAVNAGDILGAKDDFRDEWDHDTNHVERDKLLDAVFAKSHEIKAPAIFLSGDVHMSAVFHLANRNFRGARVFQVTSSPITRPPAPEIAGLILNEKGTLKSGKNDTAYRYRRLAKFHTRNFCILKSEVSATQDVGLHVDFYGESEDRDEMRRKRVTLI